MRGKAWIEPSAAGVADALDDFAHERCSFDDVVARLTGYRRTEIMEPSPFGSDENDVYAIYSLFRCAALAGRDPTAALGLGKYENIIDIVVPVEEAAEAVVNDGIMESRVGDEQFESYEEKEEVWRSYTSDDDLEGIFASMADDRWYFLDALQIATEPIMCVRAPVQTFMHSRTLDAALRAYALVYYGYLSDWDDSFTGFYCSDDDSSSSSSSNEGSST